MCKEREETVDRLFVTCPFSRSVWNEVLQLAKGKNKWDQRSLVGCYFSWVRDKSEKSF